MTLLDQFQNMSWQLTAAFFAAVSLAVYGVLMGSLAPSKRRRAALALAGAGVIFALFSLLLAFALYAFGQAYAFERRLVFLWVCLAGCMASFVAAILFLVAAK